jgi:hypothetical protein
MTVLHNMLSGISNIDKENHSSAVLMNLIRNFMKKVNLKMMKLSIQLIKIIKIIFERQSIIKVTLISMSML